ncbi:MAG: SEC-C metal-binding domain-containing protein [Polyangiaceae bacterium]
MLRRELGAVIAATNKSFVEIRRTALAQRVHAKRPRATRVGRNQPCPCGSGKKFKRCCIDRTTPSPR